jgi:hypothetical protein
MPRRRRLAPFSLIIIIIIRYSLFLILHLTTIFFFLSFPSSFFFSFFRLSHTSRFPLFIQSIGAEDFSSARLECYFPLASFFFFSPRVLLKRLPLLNKKTLATAGVDQGPQKHRRSIDVLYSIPSTTAVVSDDVARASPPPVQSQHMHSPHADIAGLLLLQCRVTTPGVVSPAAAICISSFVFLLVSLTHGGRKRMRAEEEENHLKKPKILGCSFQLEIFFYFARGITGCDFGVGDFFSFEIGQHPANLL